MTTMRLVFVILPYDAAQEMSDKSSYFRNLEIGFLRKYSGLNSPKAYGLNKNVSCKLCSHNGAVTKFGIKRKCNIHSARVFHHPDLGRS
jgi:hypothetical protein